MDFPDVSVRQFTYYPEPKLYGRFCSAFWHEALLKRLGSQDTSLGVFIISGRLRTRSTSRTTLDSRPWLS